MFKKFLHDETAIIGLKSLGLAKPSKLKSTKKQVEIIKNDDVAQQEKASKLFTSTTPVNIESSIHLKFAPKNKTLEGLFGRDLKVNTNR